MRRTRKWAYVAQEATRLADLGLPPGDIATRLEVQISTVTRWMSAGKITDTRFGRRRPEAPTSPRPSWAASVRAMYALDASDEELVRLGEECLRKVYSPQSSAHAQLSATSRFVAIVKQLALVARSADATVEPSEPEPAKTPEPAREIPHRMTDPRRGLQAVK